MTRNPRLLISTVLLTGSVFTSSLFMGGAPGSLMAQDRPAPVAQDKPDTKSEQDRARELRASRNRFRHLASRAIASKHAITDLEERLAKHGWAINSDLAGARVRMDEFMDDAETDLKDGNVSDAEQSMDYAEAAIQRVEKLLGVR
jgi:hypothetical protein